MKEFKKKNIVLFALVMTLVVVSYVNYTLFYDGEDVSKTSANVDEDPVNTQLVNANVSEEDIMGGKVLIDEEFFTNYKMERDKTRSSSIEALQSVSEDETASKEIIAKAQEEIISLVGLSEKELIVENLIKSKGFDDCVVLIHSGNANVILLSNGITPAQAAQIQDIVSKECAIEISNISIATNVVEQE